MVIYVYIYIKVLFFGSCITGHLHKNKLLTLSHSADQEVPGMKQVVKTKHPSKSGMSYEKCIEDIHSPSSGGVRCVLDLLWTRQVHYNDT